MRHDRDRSVDDVVAPPVVDGATVRALAAAAGLALPDEDVPYVEAAFTEYLEKSAPLHAFSLVEPTVASDWDPRW